MEKEFLSPSENPPINEQRLWRRIERAGANIIFFDRDNFGEITSILEAKGYEIVPVNLDEMPVDASPYGQKLWFEKKFGESKNKRCFVLHHAQSNVHTTGVGESIKYTTRSNNNSIFLLDPNEIALRTYYDYDKLATYTLTRKDIEDT